MFEAQYLLEGATVYGPWVARGGDNLLFTADLVSLSDGKLEVRVYHKALEDEGDGVSVGPTLVATAVGQSARITKGLKDLVRYQYKSVSTAGSPTDIDRVLFRMLTPVWFDAVQ